MRKFFLALVGLLFSITLFSQQPADSVQAYKLLQEGRQLQDSLPQQALEYFLKAEKKAEKLHDNRLLLSTLEELRSFYVRRSLYEEAVPYYEKSIALYQKLKDTANLIIMEGNLGVLHYFLGNYAEAIKHLSNLENLARLSGDSASLAQAFTNLGQVYNKIDDTATACKYFNYSLELSQKLNDLSKIANAYNNIGILEQKKGNDSLAIIYLTKAKKIFHHLWDKEGYITTLINIALSESNLGQSESAKKHLYRALKYAQGYNDRLLAEIYTKLGQLFYSEYSANNDKASLDSALYYLPKAFDIAQSLGLTDIKRQSGKLLWQLYKQNKDYKKALFFHEQYMQAKDSLYALKKIEVINKIQAKNQIKRQEEKIAAQQKEIERNTIEILKQKQKINIALILLISLFSLLVSTILLYIKNQKEKEKIRLLENKQKVLIKNIPGYVAVKDTELRYTYVDDKFAQFMEKDKDQIIGKTDQELGVSEMGCLELDLKVIETEKPIYDIERKVEHEDHIHWLLVSKIPIFDQNHTLKEILTFFIDVTEKKEAQLKLIQFKTAVEQSGSIIVMTDINGTITYVNKRFTTVTGFSEEEAIGQNPRILNAGIRKKKFFEGMWKAILAGRTWRGVFINKKKNGELFYEKAIIAPIKQDGEIKGFIAIKEDITQERENKLKLIEKTRQFENTISNMQDVYIRTNEKYEITKVSQSVKEYMELDDPNELLNKSIFDVLDIDSPITRQRIINLIQNRKTLNFTFKYITKKRKIKFAESRLIVLPNKGIEGIIRDITKRIEWERTLARINKELNEKNRQIEEFSKSLTDNINYAALIQKAMLPREEEFLKVFSSVFLLYRPMKIVSGDFYYLNIINDKIIFALGDCTGHGVSGAFISSLAYATLNEILATTADFQPEQILENLRKKIKSVFSGSKLSDGLDMALFIYTPETKELKFAGANQVAILIQNNQTQILKGDSNPIGKYPRERPFTCKSYTIHHGDQIYLFSDGFIDQFGGKKNSKFYRKNFIKLIEQIKDFEMDEQKSILEQTFEQWKGSNHQTDDVTVIGIKI